MIRISKIALVFLGLSSIIQASYAKKELFTQQISGTALAANATFTVTDGQYTTMRDNPLWPDKFTNYKVINRLIFRIDPNSGSYQSANYTASVTIRVKNKIYNKTTKQFNDFSFDETLTINFATSGSYKDRAVLQYVGGNQLEVQVLSVSIPASQPDLILEGQIEAERYYKFNVNAYIPESGLGYTDNSVQKGELEVWWDPIYGAEEYDLEWTYVNNIDKDTQNELPPGSITIDKNIFKFNSTRITTVNTTYSIPLIYEKGYILFRIRGVGRKGANFELPVQGRWSDQPANAIISMQVQSFIDAQTTFYTPAYTVSNFPHKFKFQGHEDNLNWQSAVSFAEEGKNKASISYYDGSLRNRQSVTRLNTEDKVMAGETIYDHQGRPAIQVLPVPLPSEKIDYKEELSLNPSGDPYSRSDFDLDVSNCEVQTDAMSTDAGASRYYSPDNPDKAGAQAFVPDAEGYPFSQIEYMPDNTGRVKRQGGVGDQHQLGSDHETKYLYNKPFQEELDRFFGANVGYSERYKKNVVRDANGQFSISYLDPQGKVVATSLAGATPASLLDVTATSKNMKIDLLEKKVSTDRNGVANKLSPDRRSWELDQQIGVTSPATRTFTYELTSNTYLATCPPTTTCYDCVLDLSMSLKDECGNEILANWPANGNKARIGDSTSGCTGPVAYIPSPSSFVTPLLSEGTYSLSKKLTVNDEVLRAYTASYLAGNCILKLENFITTEMQNVDTTGCDINCDSCLANLGTYAQYDINVTPNCNPCYTEAEYNQLKANCESLCEKTIRCDEILESMIMDVSPMGQYGETMVSKNNGSNSSVPDPNNVNANEEGGGTVEIDPSYFPLSVFNQSNYLPRKDEYIAKSIWPNWRYPYNPGLEASAPFKAFDYLDENGEIAYIKGRIENGTLIPELRDGSTHTPGPDNTFTALPKDIKFVKDFITFWKDSWGKSLVAYHPEYGLYTFCTILENAGSHAFDGEMANASEIADLPPSLELHRLPEIDPFFDENLNPLFRQKDFDAMENIIDHYMDINGRNVTMKQAAWLIANCPYAINDTRCQGLSDCLDDGESTPFINFSDKAWQAFRGLYTSAKQDIVQRRMISFAIPNECYNGCIGVKHFNPFAYGFYQYPDPQFTFYNSQYFNNDQPCKWYAAYLYKDKMPRFPIRETLNITGLNAADCIETPPPGQPYDPEYSFEPVNCKENNMAMLEAGELAADRSFFEQCGQCPLTRDLQLLLNALISNNELASINILLSCYPDSKYPEFIPELEEKLTFPSSGNIYWNKISNTGGLLHARFQVGSGASSTYRDIKLKFDNSSYSFSNLKDICCLKVIYNPLQFPADAGKNFRVNATLKRAGNTDTVVFLEGLVTFKLDECSFPAICEPNPEITDLQILFNGLAHPAGNNFNPGTSVSLHTLPYDSLISPLLRTKLQEKLGGDGTLWKWKVTARSSSLIEAYIEQDIPGASCSFNFFNNSTDGYDFANADIIRLKAINVNADAIGDPTAFEVKALMKHKTNGTYKYVKLTGYANCFNIGNCKEPVSSPQ